MNHAKEVKVRWTLLHKIRTLFQKPWQMKTSQHQASKYNLWNIPFPLSIETYCFIQFFLSVAGIWLPFPISYILQLSLQLRKKLTFGSVFGAYLFTGIPSLLTRNFVKFHLIKLKKKEEKVECKRLILWYFFLFEIFAQKLDLILTPKIKLFTKRSTP